MHELQVKLGRIADEVNRLPVLKKSGASDIDATMKALNVQS
jgi:hypothetical protein